MAGLSEQLEGRQWLETQRSEHPFSSTVHCLPGRDKRPCPYHFPATRHGKLIPACPGLAVSTGWERSHHTGICRAPFYKETKLCSLHRSTAGLPNCQPWTKALLCEELEIPTRMATAQKCSDSHSDMRWGSHLLLAGEFSMSTDAASFPAASTLCASWPRATSIISS